MAKPKLIWEQLGMSLEEYGRDFNKGLSAAYDRLTKTETERIEKMAMGSKTAEQLGFEAEKRAARAEWQRQEKERRQQEAAASEKRDKYYSVRVRCCNCGYEMSVDVLKGTPRRTVTSVEANLECPNCEIDTKRWNWTSQFEPIED